MAFFLLKDGWNKISSTIYLLKEALMWIKSFFILGLVFFCFSRSQAQNKDPLQGNMYVSRIVKEKENGEFKYTREKNVEKTKPGDILEYVIKYTNVSSNPLQDIEVLGPVPKDTYLLAGSVSARNAGGLKASMDGGKSYGIPPLKKKIERDGKVIEVEVPEKEWTNLKWAVKKLLPGEWAAVRYWVTVK